MHRVSCVKSFRLRNDLYCVEWGVKLYSLTVLSLIFGWCKLDTISQVMLQVYILVIVNFRKYKADIEAYISTLVRRDSAVSSSNAIHDNVPRLPWRVCREEKVYNLEGLFVLRLLICIIFLMFRPVLFCLWSSTIECTQTNYNNL